ncbi:hypothetical protein CAPTEDRAFT_105919, partial [Capitella teleta]
TKQINFVLLNVSVSEGSNVVFCARGEAAGKALEAEVNAQGHSGKCHFVVCDLTKEEDIKAMVAKTVELYGRIDCLINNAGQHPDHKDLEDWTLTEFMTLFQMNVSSYFLTAKYAMPHLRKVQGCVINDSSLVAQIGQVGAVPYVTTKGAITAMTRAMAVDEAKHEVRVNTISPGNVWTPMWEGIAIRSGCPGPFIESGRDAQLLGRFGTIEEAGYLCLYLAAEGTFLTGADIPLSGGAELNYGRKNRRRASSGVYD